MPPFLTSPITNKDTWEGRASDFLIGQSNMQGWRENMEDAHLISLNTEGSKISVLGVFDGHGGDQVAKAVSSLILKHITNSPEWKNKSALTSTSMASILCKAFFSVDEEIRVTMGSSTEETGATGLVVVIMPQYIIVANCGDTRCIISCDKKVSALSVDHKPTDESEKTRIVQAGGTVFRKRVCGGVAVSRSFGDFWFKRNEELQAHAQQVTVEPYIHTHERSVATDEFLVCACDGIYDVLTNEQIQKYVVDALTRGIRNPGTIAELIMTECLSRGSRDNMSVIIVLFEGAAKQYYRKKHSCVIS